MLKTPIYKFPFTENKDTFRLSYITLYSLINRIDEIMGSRKQSIESIDRSITLMENTVIPKPTLFSKAPSISLESNSRDYVSLRVDKPGLILTSYPNELEYEWQIEFDSAPISYDKLVRNNSEIKIHNTFSKCGILYAKVRLKDFGGLESLWSEQLQIPISKHTKTNLDRFYFDTEPKFGESCTINLEFNDNVIVQKLSSESGYIESVEKINNLTWKLIPKTGVSANINVPIKVEWVSSGCPGEFVLTQEFKKDVNFNAEWMWTRNGNVKVYEDYIFTTKGARLVRMDYSITIDERKEKFLKFDDAVLDYFIDSGKIYVVFDIGRARFKIGVFDLDYNYISEYTTPDFSGDYGLMFKKLNVYNNNIYIYVSVDSRTFLKVYNISQLTSFEEYFDNVNNPDSFSWFNFKYSFDTVFFKDDLLINKEIDLLGGTLISVYNNATDKLNEIYLEKTENVFVEKYNDKIIICSNEKNNQPNSIVIGILDSDLYMQSEYIIGSGLNLKLYEIKIVGDILILLIRDDDKLGFRVVEFSLVDQTQNSTIIDYNVDTQTVLEQLQPYDVFPRGVSYSNDYLFVESSLEKFYPRIMFITLPNGCIRFLGDSSMLDPNGEFSGPGDDGNTYTAVNRNRLNEIVANIGINANLNQYVTTLVTSMGSLFYRSHFTGDISKWDVSNVTLMNNMFMQSQFNSDISRWDVSNVINMDSLFQQSLFIGDISQWDVSSVIDMYTMFYQSPFNGDISQWDVSRVNQMSMMFFGCDFNGDISQWDVSNVIDMDYMFKDSKFNQDISLWNVSKVIDMSGMFKNSPFNQDISQWDVSSVVQMDVMFYSSHFNQDISQWDVSSVTTMEEMFAFSPFNQDISQWDVSNVTTMKGLFHNTPFNQDISSWDFSNVTTMNSIFRGSQFNQDISSWDISNVTDMSHMFTSSPFNQDISQWDVSNVTNMDYMFYSTTFDQDISRWDVSSVTTMVGMFGYASFNQDISQWDVSSVTDMRLMIRDSSFDQDISQWNTINVNNCNDFAKNAPICGTPKMPTFPNCTSGC